MTISQKAIEALESARSHILDAYRIWQADDVSAVPPTKSGAGSVIAKIDAVLSTLPIAGEVKVNQLEWSTISFGDEIADSILGTYTITGGETYFVWFAGQSDSEDYAVAAPSMEAAKAAAQADYNTRILSALSSSPGKDGGQEVAVGEPHADAMRVIDPDQWEACSPAYLASGGICASAPRVWNAKDKNHWHPKLSAPQPASTALVERLTKALEPFAKEAGCYDPDTGDGDDTVWATPVYFKIRDLREARNALSSSQSTSTEGER